ncbi:MAG: HNH endonuclease [Dehalococcoidia bacterium]|nr:MAG: HNH endonuclease [Dehalococcoidia bacterium]
MNFHLGSGYSVILMSLRRGAPYADRTEENGQILIYEGHDIPRTDTSQNPKAVDQPMTNPSGSLTQNGLFYQAASKYKETRDKPELIRVYEKIHAGIWVYNGLFKLTDAWQELSKSRKIFKFKLEILDDTTRVNNELREKSPENNRIIPSSVKLEVWKRGKGRCVICGSKDNLHYDHIIPFSKGGSSLVAENIQLLCVRHNLAKRDKIE